jgi:serine/threonine-protein kinase
MARFRQPAAANRVFRLDISPPEEGRFVGLGNTVGGRALSPDGTIVVFVAAINGKTGLWVRALDDRTACLLPGTDGAADPVWSPDGKSIAFSAAGKVQRTDLAGNAPVTICDGYQTRRIVWSDDGQIVFGSLAGGLFRVSASGGPPSPLTQLDVSRGEADHRFPQVLPGGRFLYWAWSGKPENSGVYVPRSPSPAERAFLLRTETSALVAPGGDGRNYLLWLRGGTLLAQEFDAGALKLSGEAHAIAGPIPSMGAFGVMLVSASAGGQLLYNTAGSTSQFAWFDGSGRPLAPLGKGNMYSYPFRLAPDGRRAVATRDRPGGYDLWLLDLERGSASRFTAATSFTITRYGRLTAERSCSLKPRIGCSARTPGDLLTSSRSPRGRMVNMRVTGRGMAGSSFIRSSLPTRSGDLWVLPLAPESKVAETPSPRRICGQNSTR